MARIRPLNDFVIVDPDPLEIRHENPNVTRIIKEGKIATPDNVEFAFKKYPVTGKIFSWGDRCRYKEYFEVGKPVQFGEYSGAPMHFEGKDYYLVNERDLHWVKEP